MPPEMLVVATHDDIADLGDAGQAARLPRAYAHTPFEGRRDDLLCEGFNVVPTSEDIYNAGSWRFDAVLQPESWSAHQ